MRSLSATPVRYLITAPGRCLAATLVALLTGITAAATFDLVSPSEARYRARERVLGVPLVNAAVGVTGALSGSVMLTGDGDDAASGEITVDLRELASDQRGRDDYVHEDALETARFPAATFAVREVSGLPRPPPSGGEFEVVITGDLTVRDLTLPVSWAGTVTFEGREARLEAAVTLTFEEVGLERPRVGVLVTVAEELTLEVSARLVRR